jgi:transposase
MDFFEEFGPDRSSKLRFVCTDMWKPYLQVVAEKAGQALNILDRFHIMSHMNKGIDKVCRRCDPNTSDGIIVKHLCGHNLSTQEWHITHF